MPWEGLWEGRQLTVIMRGRSKRSQGRTQGGKGYVSLTFFWRKENGRNSDVLGFGGRRSGNHVNSIVGTRA